MKSILILFFLSLLSISSIAQDKSTDRQKAFNLGDNNIALKGYDPVSYFQGDKPLKGQEGTFTVYMGVRYHFSSEANKSTFEANPEKYEPAYGGWCAYAVGKGYTADINPETFKIIDDKLYVFYNKNLVNTLKRWNKAEDELYPASKENWPTLLKEFLSN